MGDSFHRPQHKDIVQYSEAVLGWLTSEAKELPNTTFQRILDTFVDGNTLVESFAYVCLLRRVMTTEKDPLAFTLSLKASKSRKSIDILPYPSEEDFTSAKAKLAELQIPDESIATSDLYLENPKSALKDHLVFVLGE